MAISSQWEKHTAIVKNMIYSYPMSTVHVYPLSGRQSSLAAFSRVQSLCARSVQQEIWVAMSRVVESSERPVATCPCVVWARNLRDQSLRTAVRRHLTALAGTAEKSSMLMVML